MRRLIYIARMFKEYVVFAFLVFLSLVLLSSNDNRQMRMVRAYTIGIVGVLQDAMNVIPNVFALQRENIILRKLNVDLADEVSRLRAARLENLKLRELLAMKQRSPFHLLAAEIVGKSTLLLHNTLTIDVGETEGVMTDMPIISQAGLVGRVLATGSHYSIGQLMLNKDFRASAKVERTSVDGIIVWQGGATLVMTNVVKTLDVRPGDVIVTSEYSNLFPRGIKIGTVSSVSDKRGSLFHEIEIVPETDFTVLNQVFVVLQPPDPERVKLLQKFGTGHP